jgi:hypothetical protein
MTDDSIRRLLQESYDALKDLYAEMASVSDRVAAISAAAFVDNRLEVAIAHKFVPMGKDRHNSIFDSGRGPLGSKRCSETTSVVTGCFRASLCR